MDMRLMSLKADLDAILQSEIELLGSEACNIVLDSGINFRI